MKRILCIAVLMLCAGCAFAGTYLSEIDVTSIPTNGAGTATNLTAGAVLGEIKAVQVIRSGNTTGATNEFYFSALVNGTLTAKTLAATTNTGDTVLYPIATGYGQTFRFPLLGQQIQVLAQNANQTGITATVYIIYERP